MNLNQLQKNIGWHVQLHPIAVRLDNQGNELDDLDDDWAIRGVTAGGIRIDNIHTGHTTLLGADHIHHFTSNPNRKMAGVGGYGFLTLTVQLFVQGRQVHTRPTAKPGERTSLGGKSAEAWAARAGLLDERFRAVMEDYGLRGTPRTMIDTFDDLALSEKAMLYERAVRLKKGRPPKNNPYSP